MRLEDIGFYTLSDERARTATHTTPIQRLECIITDRCNFKCPYCRGVKPDLRGDLALDEFKEIVGAWRFVNLTSPASASHIRDMALGWAFSRDLSCRPKNEDLAVMYKIPDGDEGWVHLRANELWEIYSE